MFGMEMSQVYSYNADACKVHDSHRETLLIQDGPKANYNESHNF